jgi:predicted histidine transporter YuiF (NhaC family)
MIKKRFILTLILGLLVTTSAPAGWFGSKERENAPSQKEAEQQAQQQRIAAEQRLHEAHQRISAQEAQITQLHTTSLLVTVGGVVLLIVGVALGSKVRRA